MEGKENFFHNLKYNMYELGRRMGEPLRKHKKPGKYHNARRSTLIFAYGVLALPVLYFLIFYVFVNFNSVMLAFKDEITGSFTFDNFKYVVMEIVHPGSSNLFLSIKNTLIFWLLNWILMPVQIIVSFILYKRIIGYKVFQTIFYLPTIIGAVVWMTAYKNFISPSGPFCKAMVSWGVFDGSDIPQILQNSDYALTGVIISSIWLGIPGNMLIYCGSLTRIPQSVIEAAKLDGVGFWKEIWYVTIPFLGPLIGTQVLLLCTGILSASGNVLLLTNGRFGTTTLSYWLYDQIVKNTRYNIPSAAGILMMLFTLPIVIISRVLTNKIEDIEY